MADDVDKDIKHSVRLSDEQRKLIEEKLRAAKVEHDAAAHVASTPAATDKDIHHDRVVKHFEPMSDEQRKLLEEKIQHAKEQHHSIAHIESPATKFDATVSHAKSAISSVNKGAFNDYALIDEQQREAMLQQVEERRQAKQHEQVIRKRLLSMAGKEVAIDENWPYNDMLMEHGQTWSSLEVNTISGPDMVTERSVAKLWQLSPTFYGIAAGYALDAAGTWHKHSWLIAQHKVQEVKLKYAVYYGVLLSAKESEAYAITALHK